MRPFFMEVNRPFYRMGAQHNASRKRMCTCGSQQFQSHRQPTIDHLSRMKEMHHAIKSTQVHCRHSLSQLSICSCSLIHCQNKNNNKLDTVPGSATKLDLRHPTTASFPFQSSSAAEMPVPSADPVHSKKPIGNSVVLT